MFWNNSLLTLVYLLLYGLYRLQVNRIRSSDVSIQLISTLNWIIKYMGDRLHILTSYMLFVSIAGFIRTENLRWRWTIPLSNRNMRRSKTREGFYCYSGNITKRLVIGGWPRILYTFSTLNCTPTIRSIAVRAIFKGNELPHSILRVQCGKLAICVFFHLARISSSVKVDIYWIILCAVIKPTSLLRQLKHNWDHQTVYFLKQLRFLV